MRKNKYNEEEMGKIGVHFNLHTISNTNNEQTHFYTFLRTS